MKGIELPIKTSKDIFGRNSQYPESAGNPISCDNNLLESESQDSESQADGVENRLDKNKNQSDEITSEDNKAETSIYAKPKSAYESVSLNAHGPNFMEQSQINNLKNKCNIQWFKFENKVRDNIVEQVTPVIEMQKNLVEYLQEKLFDKIDKIFEELTEHRCEQRSLMRSQQEILNLKEKIDSFERMTQSTRNSLHDKMQQIEDDEHSRMLIVSDLQRKFEVRMQMQAQQGEDIKHLKVGEQQLKITWLKEREDLVDRIQKNADQRDKIVREVKDHIMKNEGTI